VITHRRAKDSRKETAPALLALAITIAYLAGYALTGWVCECSGRQRSVSIPTPTPTANPPAMSDG
jgi:hypothetical protein